MKLNGLILLYDNKEIIATIIVSSIIFFIYWDKKNKSSLPLNDEEANNFKMKWYDVSQIDITSSKVGILLFLIIAVLFMYLKTKHDPRLQDEGFQ